MIDLDVAQVRSEIDCAEVCSVQVEICGMNCLRTKLDEYYIMFFLFQNTQWRSADKWGK